jgi:hypothetical protein
VRRANEGAVACGKLESLDRAPKIRKAEVDYNPTFASRVVQASRDLCDRSEWRRGLRADSTP